MAENAANIEFSIKSKCILGAFEQTIDAFSYDYHMN